MMNAYQRKSSLKVILGVLLLSSYSVHALFDRSYVSDVLTGTALTIPGWFLFYKTLHVFSAELLAKPAKDTWQELLKAEPSEKRVAVKCDQLPFSNLFESLSFKGSNKRAIIERRFGGAHSFEIVDMDYTAAQAQDCCRRGEISPDLRPTAHEKFGERKVEDVMRIRYGFLNAYGLKDFSKIRRFFMTFF